MIYRHFFRISFFSIFIFAPFLSAQETDSLTVKEQIICTSVKERKPVGADTVFSNELERLYCFIRILGAAKPTEIYHVWYHDNKEKSKTKLNVKGMTWRTWSTKRLAKSLTGQWRVDVVSAAGKVIASKKFIVKAKK